MAAGFVLCADDFAMTDGISRSILALLEQGKLSAAGAMTNRPHWRRLAGELATFAPQADLGIHLNLTCAAPLGPMPTVAPGGALPRLGDLTRMAVLSRAARSEIAAEIARQCTAFEDTLGRRPDFIDGHQHVHVLPGIRDAVIAAARSRYPIGTVYLRDPADSPSAVRARGVAVAKALVIAGLAVGFGRSARQAGIPTNRGFSGAVAFDPKRDFAADLQRFLVRPGRAHLVMCHPGFIDDELVRLDPVVATRPLEHAALAGFAPAAGLTMVRFAALG